MRQNHRAPSSVIRPENIKGLPYKSSPETFPRNIQNFNDIKNLINFIRSDSRLMMDLHSAIITTAALIMIGFIICYFIIVYSDSELAKTLIVILLPCYIILMFPLAPYLVYILADTEPVKLLVKNARPMPLEIIVIIFAPPIIFAVIFGLLTIVQADLLINNFGYFIFPDFIFSIAWYVLMRLGFIEKSPLQKVTLLFIIPLILCILVSMLLFTFYPSLPTSFISIILVQLIYFSRFAEINLPNPLHHRKK